MGCKESRISMFYVLRKMQERQLKKWYNEQSPYWQATSFEKIKEGYTFVGYMPKSSSFLLAIKKLNCSIFLKLKLGLFNLRPKNWG